MILLIQSGTHPDEFIRWTNMPEPIARSIRNEVTKSNASFAHVTYEGSEYSFNREHVAYVALAPDEV